MSEAIDAWKNVGAKAEALGEKLKSHVVSVSDEQEEAKSEVEESAANAQAGLDDLAKKLGDVFEGFGDAATDSEVHDDMREMGSLIMEAFAATFRSAAEQIEVGRSKIEASSADAVAAAKANVAASADASKAITQAGADAVRDATANAASAAAASTAGAAEAAKAAASGAADAAKAAAGGATKAADAARDASHSAAEATKAAAAGAADATKAAAAGAAEASKVASEAAADATKAAAGEADS